MAIDDLLEEDAHNTRLYHWFRRHGLSLIAGVAIGLILIGLHFYWAAHQSHVAEDAFQRYARVVDRIESKSLDQARAEIAGLSTTRAPLLVKLAGLQLAKAYVTQGRLVDATQVLQHLPSSQDALQCVVQQRLARLLLADNKPAEAIASLRGQEDSLSQEIRADAFAMQGNFSQARKYYSAALQQMNTSSAQSMMIEAKRNEMGDPAQTASGHTL